MSRGQPPSDTFTRFTATTPPSAASAPPSSSSSSKSSAFNVPSRDGETPAQKVARLRAAQRAQKEAAQLSTVDRVVARGRIWADYSHRFFTYGLIAFTGLATVISLYSLTTLVTHHRRQKRAWIDRELERLKEAQQAFLRGEADAEQLHLLEQERAGEEMKALREAEKRRKKEEGIWSRVKGVFNPGSPRGDIGMGDMAATRKQRPGEVLGGGASLDQAWVEGEVKPQLPPQSQRQLRNDLVPEGFVPAGMQQSGIHGVGIDDKGRPVPVGKMVPASASPSNRLTDSQAMNGRPRVAGGPLDVMANNAVNRVNESVSGGDGGWLSWIRGQKS